MTPRVDRQPAALAVHRATPADAAVMSAIHATCFNPPWDEAAMAQFLASPGVLCLMGAAAEIMATPAGLLIARRAADEAELLTLAVAPPCRGAGLGRALLDAGDRRFARERREAAFPGGGRRQRGRARALPRFRRTSRGAAPGLLRKRRKRR